MNMECQKTVEAGNEMFFERFHIIARVVKVFDAIEHVNKSGNPNKFQMIQVSFPNGKYDFNLLFGVYGQYVEQLHIGDVGVFYLSGEVNYTNSGHPALNINAYRIRLLNRTIKTNKNQINENREHERNGKRNKATDCRNDKRGGA